MSGPLSIMVGNGGQPISLTVTGGGVVSDSSGSHDFSLNVTASGGTAPTAYLWTTDAGALSNPNIANPTLLVSAAPQNTTTAHLTVQVTIGGRIFQGSTSCTYINTAP